MPKEPKVSRATRPVSSIPPVSHTTVVIAEEVTSSRGLQLRSVPALWLDRLLTATNELPFGEGDEALVRALVEALGSIVATYAVGACFVPHGMGDPAPQIIIKRVPPCDEERAGGGIDPTRLFPGYSHERSFDIAGAAFGSTLHVAGDDATLEDDRSAVAHVTRRACAALGGALARARAEAALDAKQRELRALEVHVIQADKLASFGQIAAGMVHELNNPLTSIVAYTDYLMRKFVVHSVPGDAAIQADDIERLSRINDSANRMLRFTRDLVSYARPSSEIPVLVVLHTVIDQAVAFCEHVLSEARARIVRRFGDDVLIVRGMPEQLAQLFVNLITNACHAMPEKSGEIVVSTELVSNGQTVRVVVADNGHGIPMENLSQVFAPFFTTKRDGRGTGLGLSIVKNIVERHGGVIRVESEGSSGTRFVIQLPGGARPT